MSSPSTLVQKLWNCCDIFAHTLEELGKRPGMLGVIFRKAQNKIHDPANLRGLSFHEGTNIQAEFERIEQTGWRK